ncbi:MAG: hypothetical protein Greene041662_958 [Candidatus Peregrinibacteria bacterium Greene0416_62]|nr:MAG: hypothetical protein Greene041662_958 [Candidatus Peregrinibacteria bacterium Greene0416_62]TSD00208.1 MAG: hypothetical protein Greene101449_294 [Candidatus Peregrinibacteria bacterium Greene1014_49]
MDEFLFYHVLACRFYPLNALNSFREACGSYDLNLLNTGWILPLRSNAYVGSFPSLYYLPIFLLWRSPDSARLVGLLFLLAQAMILARLFYRKTAVLFGVLLLFFPYAYQHIADTGPISFQITSIFLIILLTRRWFRDQRMHWLLCCTALVFLGIWTKLVYFWLLPGIALSVLPTVLEHAKKRYQDGTYVKLGVQAIVPGAVLLALLTTLFLSTDPTDASVRPLLNQVLGGEMYSLSELAKNFWNLGVTHALLNPLEATQRVFDVHAPTTFVYLWNAVMFLSVPILLLLCTFTGSSRRNILKATIYYVAFWLTFFIIARTKAAWAMHHTVLSFPFLILSVLATLHCLRDSHWHAQWKNQLRDCAGVILACFIAGNIAWYLTFPFEQRHANDDFSKVTLNRLLEDHTFASNHLYVVTHWGMYYYQVLFGDRSQAVVYIEPLDSMGKVHSLRNTAMSHGRKIAFLYDATAAAADLTLARDSFNLGNDTCIATDATWQMLLEDPTDSVCKTRKDPSMAAAVIVP